MIKPVGTKPGYGAWMRAEKQIGEIRGLLGQRMFRATLDAMPQTGKDRRAVLDKCRGRRRLPIAYTLDQMDLLVDLVELCRGKKRDDRRMSWPDRPIHRGKMGKWEYGTIEDRRHRRVDWLAHDAITDVFRCDPSGHCDIDIGLAGHSTREYKFGIYSESTPGDRYQGHGWRTTNVQIWADLPDDWYSLVWEQGLATHGGRFVVSAREVAPGVYDAVWGRQGRGYSIIMESGRIEL